MFFSPSKYFFEKLLSFRVKIFRYHFNRLISKIQLKTHFVVSTLFIVSLASFVGVRRHTYISGSAFQLSKKMIYRCSWKFRLNIQCTQVVDIANLRKSFLGFYDLTRVVQYVTWILEGDRLGFSFANFVLAPNGWIHCDKNERA